MDTQAEGAVSYSTRRGRYLFPKKERDITNTLLIHISQCTLIVSGIEGP